jgi:FkbM family methyltransferase
LKAGLRQAALNLLRGGLHLSGERGRNLVVEALSNGATPLQEVIETIHTLRGDIRFFCVGDLPLWRARTLLTKEPETIEWIDGFAPGDTYWDIGANVGIYALYAAIRRDVRVLAFEPSAGNYFLLNRNIELNGLTEVLQAFCIAFAEKTRLSALNMQNTELGGALSSFGIAVDNFGHSFTPNFRQGMVGYSVDDFIDRFNPPFPNHLKIDVDGIEDRIIGGAFTTMMDPRLKSISIELDAARQDYTDSVVTKIQRSGLALAAKRHGEMFAGGRFKNIFNYQFRRT